MVIARHRLQVRHEHGRQVAHVAARNVEAARVGDPVLVAVLRVQLPARRRDLRGGAVEPVVDLLLELVDELGERGAAGALRAKLVLAVHVRREERVAVVGRPVGAVGGAQRGLALAERGRPGARADRGVAGEAPVEGGVGVERALGALRVGPVLLGAHRRLQRGQRRGGDVGARGARGGAGRLGGLGGSGGGGAHRGAANALAVVRRQPVGDERELLLGLGGDELLDDDARVDADLAGLVRVDEHADGVHDLVERVEREAVHVVVAVAGGDLLEAGEALQEELLLGVGAELGVDGGEGVDHAVQVVDEAVEVDDAAGLAGFGAGGEVDLGDVVGGGTEAGERCVHPGGGGRSCTDAEHDGQRRSANRCNTNHVENAKTLCFHFLLVCMMVGLDLGLSVVESFERLNKGFRSSVASCLTFVFEYPLFYSCATANMTIIE
mmetsp:Transcript_14425/g.38619  ORF Transcript_14425/g.38619 Transcript_14425/m.38619 type:complete len:438 (+) Transcript_14425:336-1649(+)